jgi:hypothetical protein
VPNDLVPRAANELEALYLNGYSALDRKVAKMRPTFEKAGVVKTGRKP